MEAIVNAAFPSFSNSAVLAALVAPTATFPNDNGSPVERTYLLIVEPLTVYRVPSGPTVMLYCPLSDGNCSECAATPAVKGGL